MSSLWGAYSPRGALPLILLLAHRSLPLVRTSEGLASPLQAFHALPNNITCDWGAYPDSAWGYYPDGHPKPSNATACASACLATANCTGFEAPRDENYCAFWFQGACSSPDSPGAFPQQHSYSFEYVRCGVVDCGWISPPTSPPLPPLPPLPPSPPLQPPPSILLHHHHHHNHNHHQTNGMMNNGGGGELIIIA